MSHIELVNLALSIHGSVLLATIVAYSKYGERTELMERGLRGTNGVFTEMRRRIVVELADILESFFRSRQTAPTITDDQEPRYFEQLTNPIQSEGFRECIREYVEGESVLLADYRALLSARDHWCNWARFLSWTLLVLLLVELAVVGILGLVDRLAGVILPDWFIKWSWIPVGVLILCIALSFSIMLYKHDIMQSARLNMKTFDREYKLVDPVVRYFSRQTYTLHECELQFYDYRMDVYGFSRHLGLTVAIELKLIKWRQALRQALPYQLCADLVYVAMPIQQHSAGRCFLSFRITTLD